MLSKIENSVMNVLYSMCINKSSILVTKNELLSKVRNEIISKSKLESILLGLEQEGFIDLVYSDKHGETVYCISLTVKGKGYKRIIKDKRQNLIQRLIISILFAVISFIIGLILKAIF